MNRKKPLILKEIPERWENPKDIGNVVFESFYKGITSIKLEVCKNG